MTHRERVLTTINHQEPDRVPWDYWAAPEVDERLKRDLNLPSREALLRYFDVDFRYVLGPSYKGQQLRITEEGLIEDLWGVLRKPVTVERGSYKWAYKHLHTSPLAKMETVAEIDRYEHWPSPDWWNYSEVEAQCEEYSGYCVVNAGDRLDRTAQLKPMMYLRGMEQTLVDLKLNPAIVECIVRHIVEYFLEYNQRVFEAARGKIDIFLMGDDFGTQSGLMMSGELWRKYFRRGFRAYIELAHKYGIKVMHHTCGAIGALIPEFIDAGLDILQSLQPKAAGMDLKSLKREYGKYLCFHGSVDIQETLPRGSPEQVRAEVEERMRVGKPGGGFVISTAHSIQPDTPTENILTLFEAYRDFGSYAGLLCF